MMNIDEAIRHCEEVAEQNEELANNPAVDNIINRANCAECAASHRQLAEWLMELKDLRAEQNDQYVFIRELMDELKEAKRLLKEAVNDLRWLTRWHDPCELCGLRDEDGDCPVDTDKGIDCDDIYKWRLEEESLKLIGEDSDAE